MFSSSKRFAGRSGSIAVAMSTTATPFIQAYRFNPVSGWGTKYSDPGTVTGFGTEGRGLSFATGNRKIVLTGATGTVFAVYDWTYASGFGTRATTSSTNVDDCAFTRDGSRLLVAASGRLSEYAYDSVTGVGSEVAGINTAIGFRKCSYLWDEDYTVVGLIGTNSFNIYNRALSSLIDSEAFFGTPTVFSQSPVVHSGTRMLAVSIAGGDVRLYQIASDGTVSATITSTMGSTYHAAIFDPYGRLIVGGASNLLRIYTLDSAGNQTLLATASDFAGGTARAFAYDEDRDILFVGSSGSPFVTAYRMGGAGFVSKFANPASLPNSGVRDISLMYDEAWKYTQL
jgi:WD40 repeat protein